MEDLHGHVIPPDRLERMISGEPRPAHTDRPWVMANMVTTLDGTVALDGVSAALGNAGDREIFRILRGVSDVIVAGASTVREERYRTPSTPEGLLADRRVDHGQAPRPHLCIVTRSMRLDPPPPALADPTDDTPTLIATTDANAATVTEQNSPPAWIGPTTYIGAGEHGVDPAALLHHLHAGGTRVVLIEGGPTLLAQFAAENAIDEWNLTLSPALAGETPRLLPEALNVPRRLELVRIHRLDSHLYLRYLDRGPLQIDGN